MNLVLFDFDGTITNKDTFTKFIVSSASPARLIVGGIFILPAFILYKLGVLPASRMRPLVSKVAFAGVCEKHINAKAQGFVCHYLPTVMRKPVLDKIAQHKEKGDRVIVVSASLSPYMNIWCQGLGVEVICSELAVRKGKLTGSYVKGDCSGIRKVIHIKQRLNLQHYHNIIAYGDTEEDYPMLNIATTRFYKGKPF